VCLQRFPDIVRGFFGDPHLAFEDWYWEQLAIFFGIPKEFLE
jgi:hypothetical protein